MVGEVIGGETGSRVEEVCRDGGWMSCDGCWCVMGDEYAIVGLFFFFNDTATTEIYTLSLHDALPI